MGINKQSLILLLQADKELQIKGEFLTLGYNTVTIKHEDLIQLAQVYNKNISQAWIDSQENKDSKTKHSLMLGYAPVDQNKLLKKLFPGIDKISVMDISNYEGASLIHDLNSISPPSDYLAYFDYIYDGSVFDNIFNPANGLITVSKLLKPEGRISGVNVSVYIPGAMTALSNEFFYSYFMSNCFSGTLVYSACQPANNFRNFEFSAEWFLYTPSFTIKEGYFAIQANYESMLQYSLIHTHYYAKKNSIAENQSNVFECNNIPTNLQYIDQKCIQWQIPSRNKMLRSDNIKRFPFSGKKPRIQLFDTDHYQYIGDDSNLNKNY